jgi:hypothetical protein
MGVSDPVAVQRRRQKILANSEARLARVYGTIKPLALVQRTEASVEEEIAGAGDRLVEEECAPEEKRCAGDLEASNAMGKQSFINSDRVGSYPSEHGGILPEHKTGANKRQPVNSRAAKWAGYTNDYAPASSEGPNVLSSQSNKSKVTIAPSLSQALYASIQQTAPLRTLMGILFGVVSAIVWLDLGKTGCKAWNSLLKDTSKSINLGLLMDNQYGKALGYILPSMPALMHLQHRPFAAVLGLNLLIVALRFSIILNYPSAVGKNPVSFKSPLIERLVVSLMPRLQMFIAALSVLHQASRTILDSFGGFLLIRILVVLLCPSTF